MPHLERNVLGGGRVCKERHGREVVGNDPELKL